MPRKRLYTTKQAAEQLGIAATTVRIHCLRYGIGELVTPRVRLLTEADLERLRGHAVGSGRPGHRRKETGRSI
jgi:hypothetical protein